VCRGKGGIRIEFASVFRAAWCFFTGEKFMRNHFVRSLFVTLVAGFGAVSSVMAEPSLSERRAITAYEQGAYAVLLKDIQAAAGFAVPVEVNWASIALPDQSASYANDDFWSNVFFVPLKKALAAAAVDDMGKQAVKAKLKKIVIHYDAATAPASAYADGVSFKDGALTLNFAPYTNAGDIEPRANAIQKVLEAGL
jgi:ABC-type Na+ efflux pump permease subunit